MLLTFALLAFGNALAVGGSGGGCQPHQTFLIKAVVSGDVKAVESEISRLVDLEESRLAWASALSLKYSHEKRHHWRQETAARFARLGSCSTDPPLDYAVRTGNLEMTKYLIDIGGDPTAKGYLSREEEGRAKSTLFTRCTYPRVFPVGHTPASKARQLQAYALAIDRGGDINYTIDYSLRAMDVCKDPEIRELLRIRGGVSLIAP